MKAKLTIHQENALNFLTELVASKRKWSVADRMRFNRVVRYIKTHK